MQTSGNLGLFIARLEAHQRTKALVVTMTFEPVWRSVPIAGKELGGVWNKVGAAGRIISNGECIDYGCLQVGGRPLPVEAKHASVMRRRQAMARNTADVRLHERLPT